MEKSLHKREVSNALTRPVRFDAPTPVASNTAHTEAPKTSAFGEWDLRRENILRTHDSEAHSAVSVEKFSIEEDEDELDTPPFFRNR